MEYADTGQDEKDLRDKIETLLAAGTSYVWVVRLVGPRRVEVHERDKPRGVIYAGGQLTAPGVLENPVPVEALYDREAAHRVALRNLLQRRGYADLDAVLAKGRDEGRIEGRDELGIPAVVGCGDATSVIEDGQQVTVSCAEGDDGHVYTGLLRFDVRAKRSG